MFYKNDVLTSRDGVQKYKANAVAMIQKSFVDFTP
jgi:hypothetical protein